jgi:hypothetical protein
MEVKHGKETPRKKRVHLSKRSYHTKKSNVKKTNERHNSNSDDLGQIKKSIFKFESSDEDASIFNTICGNDLKKEVAKNVKLSMKTNTFDIFINGSFHNAKTGKSSWIKSCRDYRSAWTLKSQFIKGYIGTLLTNIKKPTINIDHSSSIYDINIQKYEFGTESVWRRKEQSKTTKRLSFLCTCDTANDRNGKQGVIKAIKFLFMTMKKPEINPIEPLVLEYLKDHASALYEYLLKKKPNEELVAKDLTNDIDKHFHAGFVLHWDDCLNH